MVIAGGIVGFGGFSSVAEAVQERTFISVSAGWAHGCGILLDNRAECWGSDFAGETSPPRGEFISVSAGEFFSCGLRPDNVPFHW